MDSLCGVVAYTPTLLTTATRESKSVSRNRMMVCTNSGLTTLISQSQTSRAKYDRS